MHLFIIIFCQLKVQASNSKVKCKSFLYVIEFEKELVALYNDPGNKFWIKDIREQTKLGWLYFIIN